MKCKWCRSEVVKGARRCPHCGGRLATHPMTGCFAVVLVALVLFVIAVALQG